MGSNVTAMSGLDDFLAEYTNVYNRCKEYYRNNFPAMTESVLEAKAHKMAEVRMGMSST